MGIGVPGFLKRSRLTVLGALCAILLVSNLLLFNSGQFEVPFEVNPGQTVIQDWTLELRRHFCAGFKYPKAEKDCWAFDQGNARSEVQEKFQEVYTKGDWGDQGGGSGSGSEIAATARPRALLEAFFYKHKVSRVLDAPCGSSNFWPPLLETVRQVIPCFEYRGLDIVPRVVSNNSYRFREDQLTTFGIGDVSVGPLPKGYDVILPRDAMQHLHIDIIIDALEQYAKADPRYFIIGSYLVHGDQERKRGGRGHQQDGLPPPDGIGGVVCLSRTRNRNHGRNTDNGIAVD